MRTGRLVLALSACLLSTSAAGAPSAVRLSFVGDPSTSVGVSWNCPAGSSAGLLEYRSKGEAKPHRVQATIKPWSAIRAVAEVALKNLTPATHYTYRVGDAAGGFSSEYSFRTAPSADPRCASFRFVFVGDSRDGCSDPRKGASSIWPAISARAASHLPSFLLHGGDCVCDGKNQGQWRHHLEVSSPLSALFPILYTLGNHDRGPGVGEGANFNRLLQLPRADPALGGSGSEDYYAFSYGNAIFVVLSTESFLDGAQPMKKQADWMDRVLARTAARWRFVFLHRPIYTGVAPLLGHPPNEVGQNAALVPVINKHHVDIVFASHNHIYERFAPSACANPQSARPCPTGQRDGTVFITSGGAGASTLIFPGRRSAVRPAASAKHHYVLVDIANDTLRLEARDGAGSALDSLIIRKASPDGSCARRAVEKQPAPS